jgi:hypothetical protein
VSARQPESEFPFLAQCIRRAQSEDAMAQSFVPGRMAVAERDALRAAGAVLDAAARSVDKCKHAIDRAKVFAAMRGQQVAKIDAVVLALTERAAAAARSYVSGNAPEPPIGLPELRRAHGARELAQAAFDLARRTVEALEGELSDAEALWRSPLAMVRTFRHLTVRSAPTREKS